MKALNPAVFSIARTVIRLPVLILPSCLFGPQLFLRASAVKHLPKIARTEKARFVSAFSLSRFSLLGFPAFCASLRPSG